MSRNFSPTEGRDKLTHRGYLILKAMQESQVDYAFASRVVAQVAKEHPEWDMDVKKTWSEWEAQS